MFMQRSVKKGPTPADIAAGKKIRELRSSLGLSVRAFCKGRVISGLHSSNLSQIERGIRKATAAMIRDIVAKYSHLISFDDLVGTTASVKGRTAKSNVRLIPVLNEVEAGGYLLSGDMDYPPGISDDYAPDFSKDPCAFFVSVRGWSMIGGDIRPGDLALVEPAFQVENGNIVVAIGPEGCTIKKFKRADENILLMPMNPEFDPLVISPEAAEEFRFYRVTSIRRKI
jgi:SOS-response transcriptional repressor LexA